MIYWLYCDHFIIVVTTNREDSSEEMFAPHNVELSCSEKSIPQRIEYYRLYCDRFIGTLPTNGAK